MTRTLQILKFLEKAEGPCPASEVAEATGGPVPGTSATLARLSRYGQVYRERKLVGEVTLDEDTNRKRRHWLYMYEITKKGRKRLAYLREAIND
jgi:DNA-binding MarR family transcriptional regulator